MHQKRKMFCFFFLDFQLPNTTLPIFYFFFFLPKTGKYVQLFPDLDNLQNRKNVQRKNKRKKKSSKPEILLEIAMPKFGNQEKEEDLWSNIIMCLSYHNIRNRQKQKVFYNSLEAPIHYHICVPLPFRENKKCIYCYWTLTHFNTIYNSLLYRCFFFLLLCFPFIHSF